MNEFIINSETTLILFMPPPINLEKQQICWGLEKRINELDEVICAVVGMNTVCVYTKDLQYKELLDLKVKLDDLYKNTKPMNIEGNTIEIPVDYGGKLGMDLANVAKAKNLSIKEFVKLHTEPLYTVYFLGFQPGFVYLGGLLDILHTPRLATPRTKIPAGSVGIGGAQTGIYPFSSPGGWQIIGNTKEKLFDSTRENPSLFKAGDRLKFIINSIEEK